MDYLRASNVKFELKNNGTTIMVPKHRKDSLLIAIANQNLIQDSYIGYELFDKTNIGMSEFVQQLNSRRATEGELQRMIKTMEGIKDVKVHLVIPKNKLFKQDDKPPTAAVKLRFDNQ
jgi:flagellar M-ring protein FliF